MDGWMEGWIGSWMDAWVDGCMDALGRCRINPSHDCKGEISGPRIGQRGHSGMGAEAGEA